MEVTDLQIANPKQAGKAPLYSLFKYANVTDYILMVFGTIGSLGMGAIQPIFFFLLANFFNGLPANATPTDFYNHAYDVVINMIIVGSIYIACGWVAVCCWITIGSRQGSTFRKVYFTSILQKDPEWFDNRQIAELPTSIATDTLKVERAAGDKLVILIYSFSMVLTAIILAIIEGLQLLLICMAFSPISIFGFYLLNRGIEQSAKAGDTSYRKSAGIAEEALQEIKTVASLNGQDIETKKYTDSLSESQKYIISSGFSTGLGVAIGTFGLSIMFATVYMVGSAFVDYPIYNWTDNKVYDISKIIVVMFVSFVSINNVGVMIPSLKIVAEGQVSAQRIFNVLEEKSTLTHGTRKDDIKGEIVFENVKFSYPTAKETQILKGMSFRLEQGDRLGIVGSTGSGKSTVVQLLMRYYEPESGTITIDGIELTKFDTHYLRNNIAVVSQEPILFNFSIFENIRYGKLTASEEEIQQAAELAGAMDFINELPDKFNTLCGTKGSQLSGGQKQRIAIARAIIRNPKILLLDEATSALDRTTEAIVTRSIESSLGNCTRITIAQNLLTIKDSTRIIMIEKGEVVEEGSHRKLMKKEGRYYHLFRLQELQSNSQDELNTKANDSEELKKKLTVAEQTMEENKYKDIAFKRMSLLGKSERKFLFLGCFASFVVGIFYPLTGMFAGLEISVIGNGSQTDRSTLTIRYGYLIIICGFLSACFAVLESYSYPRISANLTRKIREESFKAMISYESAFYDLPENNCSSLSAKLNNDCEKVSGLGGGIFGILIGVVAALISAHGSAIYFSWRMSLVVLAIVPILIFGVASTFLAQMQGLVKYDYESATSIVSDSIINYRTTKAFNLEGELIEKYLIPIKQEQKAVVKKAFFSGLSYGVGFGLIFYTYALLFWYGAKLIKDETNNYNDVITAMMTALSGTEALFTIGIFAPDVKNGIDAGKRLFKILEYVPLINVNSKEGNSKNIQGKIEFSNVDFSYPNRTYLAAKNINFVLEPGRSLGVIGRTGSGKSTIMQLILRQYDPINGKVKIDDIDIKLYNIKSLRSQISVVSQEPVLFTGTIRENISYGMNVSEAEVKEAAIKAQAIDFIKSHQDGFDREVGIKGSKLSGGQKQRIAIARAIIRNPKILLMDEATSALDASTESEVLKQIREIIKDATCIMIAHRLKTIDNCDYVMVLESGRIMEIGERETLKNSGGYYSVMSNLNS